MPELSIQVTLEPQTSTPPDRLEFAHPRWQPIVPAPIARTSLPQTFDRRPSRPVSPQTVPIPANSIPTNSIPVAAIPSAAIPSAAISQAKPRTGGQLYHQRLAALNVGRLYTRIPSNSFESVWRDSLGLRPTYEQWRKLLKLESRAVAGRRSGNVSVLLGDSLSLWFPIDRLPSSSIWLNQGISGETTQGVLARSGDIRATRPGAIYIMAGVNDLKRGLSDREILQNIQRLCQRYAGTPIVVQSILPTRSAAIPNERIARLNGWIEQIARKQGAYYLNIHSKMVAADGYIRSEYTTDGIHLSDRGYAVWQQALTRSEAVLAQARTSNTIASR